MQELIKHIEQYNTNQKWNNPYNQVMFLNYDPNASVWLDNVLEVPKAITFGGAVYPTVLSIDLNVSCQAYRNDVFNFDFKGSATARLVVIYYEYKSV